MTTPLRRAWERATKSSAKRGLRFDRPLLLFQSDDWGRVGVRDGEGWEELQAAGIPLGEKPYDFYAFETAADLEALRDSLSKHRDSVGRNPSIVMNFIMANLDFDKCLESGTKEIPLVPISVGLPGQWHRPRLFEAYQQGVQDGVFFPALHGLTHFCVNAVRRELAANGERAQLIREMWCAQTPYIHWRMPWIGFEYWDAELNPERRFLPLDDQRSAIHRAAEIYQALFQSTPFSACAPGYRANDDTHTAWFEAWVRVAQNGPGARQAPYLDRWGMLHTFRTIDMEPATTDCDLESLTEKIEHCFHRGLPAIVSVHSINFHSTLRDFRTPTLALLDQLLTALEARWPNLLYVHDADLFQIASEGYYRAQGKKVTIRTSLGENR
jgi:hypothetical protein